MDKSRIELRTQAVLAARLRCARGDRPVSLMDASSRGARAMMVDPPERGEFVELRIGQHALVGQVRWRVGKRFGLRFRDRISVMALLEGRTDSLALGRQACARPDRGGLSGGLTSDVRVVARTIQFAVVLAFVAAAGWTVSWLSGQGLASLGIAREAMSADRPAIASKD